MFNGNCSDVVWLVYVGRMVLMLCRRQSIYSASTRLPSAHLVNFTWESARLAASARSSGFNEFRRTRAATFENVTYVKPNSRHLVIFGVILSILSFNPDDWWKLCNKLLLYADCHGKVVLGINQSSRPECQMEKIQSALKLVAYVHGTKIKRKKCCRNKIKFCLYFGLVWACCDIVDNLACYVELWWNRNWRAKYIWESI